MKIMTIVGTRPEIIKMSRTIYELDKNFDNILINTNQNFTYELGKIFFKDLKIRKADYNLKVDNKINYKTIAKTIDRCGQIMQLEKPRLVILLGDTNSCFAAISAKKLNIPIFHLEAGNRCYDENVPEEINRRIIDHTSEINLVYTEQARHNLIREGIHPQTIIKTGSPMKEVINFYKKDIENSKILKKFNLTPNNYIIMSIHRSENLNIEKNFTEIFNSLIFLTKKTKKIIFSTHPAMLKKIIQKGKKRLFDKIVTSVKPLCFTDYIKLQKNSDLIISDSGTLMEETALLNLKSIMIRKSHERPEGMDTGTLIVSGLEFKNIIKSINVLKKNNYNKKIPQDYDVDDFSKKIVKIILSYFGYIKYFSKRN
jgi:UDP-N-acetylglucosamine 2-epimerase